MVTYFKNSIGLTALLSFIISLQPGLPAASETEDVRRQLGNQFTTFDPPHTLDQGASASIKKQEKAIISLRDVLSLALLQNPALQAYSWEIRKKEAEQVQAGLRPNPEIEGELENAGLEEFSVGLAQVIELGGKRALRIKLSGLEANLAAWDYETKRLDVLTEATIRFIEIVGTQRYLTYLDEALALADSILQGTERRISAGASMAVEGIRAEVAIAELELEKRKAQNIFEAQKKALAALWAVDKHGFEGVEGELEMPDEIPELATLVSQIEQNPQLARWIVEMELRAITLKSTQADKIPNLTISGGYIREQELKNNIIAAGISIELPIFNKNQGEISAAHIDLHKARLEKREIELRVQTELHNKYTDLKNSFDEAKILANTIIPKATTAFEETNRLYRLGKIKYLDLLDVQRSLTDLRVAYNEALTQFAIAKTEIEFLIGKPLHQ